MPVPGDQHKANHASANPFENGPLRISEYTAIEIATLQSRLDKQLGPEYISARPGPTGGKVHYLAAEKVINLANDVFGFNGWSSQIQSTQIDFIDEGREGRISLGLSTISRVTLRDGTFHEDIGYGHIENCKGKAAAFEKAKKEAATDALKRALRNFGNVLGNCLYDKDYLSRVTKVKTAPTRWDEENLHRHPDYAPIKKESLTDPEAETKYPRTISAPSLPSRASTDHDDEFGGNLFDEVELSESHAGNPDEVMLHDQSSTSTGLRTASGGANRGGHGVAELQQHQKIRPQAPPRQASMPAGTNQSPERAVPQMNPPPNPNTRQDQSNVRNPSAERTVVANASMSSQFSDIAQMSGNSRNNTPPEVVNVNTDHPHHQQTPNGRNDLSPHHPHSNPSTTAQHPNTGFTTSRNAELFQAEVPPPATTIASLPRFNPAAEPSSIRRTSGVDHASTKPIPRNIVNQQQASSVSSRPAPHAQSNTPAQTTSRPPPQSQHHTPSNFVNPAADSTRRIGMPGGAGTNSPLGNRGGYRPPGPANNASAGVKRPHPGAQMGQSMNGNEGARSPLADVSNVPKGGESGAKGSAGGKEDDVKRMKIERTAS